MKTLIKSSQYNHEDEYQRIQGVIDYLNDLRTGLFTNEELDNRLPQAQEVYYCDFYCCEVDNGGLSQFFAKTDADINHFVLNGLDYMKAFKNKQFFINALNKVENAEEDSIDEVLDRLTDQFYDIDSIESIEDFNYNYIAKIDDLKIVADDDYQIELTAILSTLTDYQERKSSLDKFLADNKPRYQIIVETLCEQYDLELISVNMMDYGDDIVSEEQADDNEKNGIMFYHITTNQGYYYIIDTPELCTLVEGHDHYVLGSMMI